MPDVVPDIPPLARLIQGGRGGGTRLRLYLLLTMIAPRPVRHPQPADPDDAGTDAGPAAGTGPRRITSNMKWLADNHFIKLTRRPGQTPSIQLLDPLWSDKPLPPEISKPMGDPRRGRYVSLPIGFWSNGWLLYLSPVAIAVMLALSELLGGSKVPRYMLRDRRESYALSHDSWTRGRHELEASGLLTVKRVPQGDDWDYTRLRNSYWLEISPLDRALPTEAAS